MSQWNNNGGAPNNGNRSQGQEQRNPWNGLSRPGNSGGFRQRGQHGHFDQGSQRNQPNPWLHQNPMSQQRQWGQASHGHRGQNQPAHRNTWQADYQGLPSRLNTSLPAGPSPWRSATGQSAWRNDSSYVDYRFNPEEHRTESRIFPPAQPPLAFNYRTLQNPRFVNVPQHGTRVQNPYPLSQSFSQGQGTSTSVAPMYGQHVTSAGSYGGSGPSTTGFTLQRGGDSQSSRRRSRQATHTPASRSADPGSREQPIELDGDEEPLSRSLMPESTRAVPVDSLLRKELNVERSAVIPSKREQAKKLPPKPQQQLSASSTASTKSTNSSSQPMWPKKRARSVSPTRTISESGTVKSASSDNSVTFIEVVEKNSGSKTVAKESDGAESARKAPSTSASSSQNVRRSPEKTIWIDSSPEDLAIDETASATAQPPRFSPIPVQQRAVKVDRRDFRRSQLATSSEIFAKKAPVNTEPRTGRHLNIVPPREISHPLSPVFEQQQRAQPTPVVRAPSGSTYVFSTDPEQAAREALVELPGFLPFVNHDAFTTHADKVYKWHWNAILNCYVRKTDVGWATLDSSQTLTSYDSYEEIERRAHRVSMEYFSQQNVPGPSEATNPSRHSSRPSTSRSSNVRPSTSRPSTSSTRRAPSQSAEQERLRRLHQEHEEMEQSLEAERLLAEWRNELTLKSGAKKSQEEKRPDQDK